MTTEPESTELVSDEQPKNGTWVDTCDVISEPTETESSNGEIDGETVDYTGSDEEPTDV